jgi:hypothetical protein
MLKTTRVYRMSLEFIVLSSMDVKSINIRGLGRELLNIEIILLWDNDRSSETIFSFERKRENMHWRISYSHLDMQQEFTANTTQNKPTLVV